MSCLSPFNLELGKNSAQYFFDLSTKCTKLCDWILHQILTIKLPLCFEVSQLHVHFLQLNQSAVFSSSNGTKASSLDGFRISTFFQQFIQFQLTGLRKNASRCQCLFTPEPRSSSRHCVYHFKSWVVFLSSWSRNYLRSAVRSLMRTFAGLGHRSTLAAFTGKDLPILS